MPADLQMSLLLRIMKRLGELRDVYPNWVTTPDLLELIPEFVAANGEQRALHYLDRHLVFLEQRGFIAIGTPTLGSSRTIRLTAEGEMFVQPELAEFGNEPLLPQVVQAIERQILTYPEERRSPFLFDLREAIAKNAPDIFAKLVVEILPKLLGP
jgi:hypothetical protein